MMIGKFKILPVLLVAIAAMGESGAAADNLALQPAEEEMTLALTELDNLLASLATAERVNKEGNRKVEAARAMTQAKELFKAGQFLPAIRELSSYMNLTQVPNKDLYLDAQYMLGRAYEAVEFDQRAIRAYLRYIGTYITYQPDKNSELLDVLHRLMPLASKQTPQGGAELRKLLSSITNLSLPAAQKAEIMYFAANTAAKGGEQDLALEWYSEAESAAKDPALKARTLYFQAVIALAKDEFERADKFLGAALAVEGDGAKEYADLAKLARARISVHRKNPQEAIFHYDSIAADSSSYKNAVFESIYILMKLDRKADAKTKAYEYLKRYPEGKQAFQIKTLLSYLDLEAGNLDAAKQGIANADDDLDAVAEYMRTAGGADQRLTQAEVTELMRRTADQVEHSPMIEEGNKLFGTLAELHRRLADTRGHVRNLVYTLGRTNIETFRPYWVRRSKQLDTAANDSLLIGHRLIASIRQTLGGAISPVDAQELSASEARRHLLLGEVANLRRKREMWASWSNLIDLTQQIAKHYGKIKSLQAEIAAARHLQLAANDTSGSIATIPLGTLPPPKTGKHLADLEEQSRRSEAALMRSLEVLRAQKISELLLQSPHRAARRFNTQYANALHTEATVISKYFEESPNLSSRSLADDFQKAWKRFEYVSKNLDEHFTKFDREVEADLKSLLTAIDSYDTRYEEINERLQAAIAGVEKTLGQSFAQLRSHYDSEVKNRKAKHRKWQADIEWLEYSQSKTDLKNIDDKYNLEKQILRDNLNDLEQGVLRQWPQ